MLLAFTVNSFVYFAFGNIYSSKILNYQSFQEQFHSGIYQYRILSGHFLVWIYDFLGTLNINYEVFKLKFLNPNSEPQMYLSFYILNTFFIILTAVMMTLIAENKRFITSDSEKILITSVGIFVIAITQFVIVPYDISSYFFLLLFIWIFLKYLENLNSKYLILLAIVLIVSTINRESSALSISFAATLLYAKFGLKKETIIPIFILGITFLITYLGMRFINESFTTNDGSLLKENFTLPKNLLGILFWIVFFAFTILISKDQKARKNILVFHLISLPYILMSFYTGILYEIRLYIPLFLTSLFLSRIKTSSINVE